MSIEFFPVINLGLTALVGLAISWVQLKRGKIVSYTKEEKNSLENKGITSNELAAYHANINWGSYSVLLVSLFCVLVSVLYVEIGSYTPQEKSIFTIAALEMGIAGTILIFSDLVHMNGISPIVHSSDRHRIVNSSIRAGVLSIAILLAGMQTFSILIGVEVMYFLCFVEILVVMYFSWIRPISKNK